MCLIWDPIQVCVKKLIPRSEPQCYHPKLFCREPASRRAHMVPLCLLILGRSNAKEPPPDEPHLLLKQEDLGGGRDGGDVRLRHDQIFSTVVSSLEGGDLQTAHLRAQALLGEFPLSVSALSIASAVASQRGQHVEAHAFLDTTLRVLAPDDPEEPRTVLQLATELVTLRRTSTAKLVLQQLLSRADPIDPSVAKGARTQLARLAQFSEQQKNVAVAFSATAAQVGVNSPAFVNMPAAAAISPPPGRPRLIIFVHTCAAFEQSRAEVLRRTWAKDRFDVIFITDNPASELDPHEYLGPYQTKGSADLSYHPTTLTRMFELFLHKYAFEADWLMVIDDDSYLFIERLLSRVKSALLGRSRLRLLHLLGAPAWRLWAAWHSQQERQGHWAPGRCA